MSAVERFKGAQPVKTDDVHAFFEESKGLERSFIREVLRSRRNAWYVAGVAGFFGFVCLGTLLVNIKESSKPVPPFILRVDNATGQVDVLSVMKTEKQSYGDVIDTYWTTQYVLHRESYDWDTIQADYNATGLMSSPLVASEYHNLFSGPNARDKTLADRARILVQMEANPVVDPNTHTATARFTTTQRWRNGQPDEVHHWIATIAYQYVNSPMKPQERAVNPLGFQVTSYRVDPELGTGN